MAKKALPQTSTPQTAAALIQVTNDTAAHAVLHVTAMPTVAVQKSLDGTGKELPCQWVGCSEKCSTVSALYEHVCERHIGHKSTKNLNLTCQWGTCSTTTIKRDRITSHIRVHVPLRTHKCGFCGKAFKRPQDLKKHVKTHANDPEIRSPEPGLKHHHDMMLPQNPKGYAADAPYYDDPIHSISGQACGRGSPPYYQTPRPLPPANSHSFVNAYCALRQAQERIQSYNLKRGYDALNEVFGDLKRRQFDPSSYVAEGQRLLGLQASPLPIFNGTVPEYQHMPATVIVADGGGYSPRFGHATGSHLPSISNVRTKSDLTDTNQFLDQMQNTIFENDKNVAAAGVAQSGARYMQGAMGYCRQLPSDSAPSQPYNGDHFGPDDGYHNPHPLDWHTCYNAALSAQSYTSQHSPISLPQNSRVSLPHKSDSSMYTCLPSTAVSGNMNAAYSTAPSHVHLSALNCSIR